MSICRGFGCLRGEERGERREGWRRKMKEKEKGEGEKKKRRRSKESLG